MAATNFTPIILYHTTTASAAPTAGNLNNGELAINITDGKLFYKDNGGTVQVIATKGTGTIGGSNTQVQYNSSGALAGSANFTFNGTTATINTLNLTNALGTAYGGTALTTYTQGDLVYASAANTLAKLGIGANTYILTSTGSVPQWSAPSAVTVATATNLAGGAAGSVPYQSGASTTTFLSIGTSGQILSSTGSAPQWSSPAALTKTDDTNVTLTLGGSASTALVNAASLTLGWTGQLSIARGGTNATATPTAGAVAYGTGTAYAFTAAGTSGQVLTSNGAGVPTWASLSSIGVTTFSAGTTGFTPSTATSGAITLAGTLATTNGGTGLTSFTANGVVYASSSSALATGSALTFDNASATLSVAGTGSRGVRLLGGGNGAVDIAGDGTTYAIGLNFYNSTSYSTLMSGIYVYGSGGAYQYMSLGGSTYNNGAIYIDSNKKVGILKLPSAQFDSINTVSMQNAQSTGLGYGAAITQGTGTLAMAAGTGNQRGNLMTIYGAQGSPTTTIPYGADYNSLGLTVAMDVAAGGGYNVTGIGSYVRTDGSGSAFRANIIQTNGSVGTYTYGFYAESSSGANINYGFYQAGSSTYNYLNGWLGVGANNVPYGNTTYERMTIEGNTNTRSWLSIRNVNSGSGSYAGVVVNAYGNSWAFEMGSTAANSNALNITKDIYGTPQVMAYMATSGVMTFYGDNGNRPFVIGGGYSKVKGESGGWQIGYYTLDSAGTTKGGFGAAGSNTTQDYNFIGPDATNSFARFNANGIGVAGTTPSTSGVGITFPATQSASSGANTLDDYEEGTWTPAVRGSGTAGTYQLSTAEGAYVKIGQQVTLTCRVIFATITGGGTGYMQITGAPSFNNAYVSAGAVWQNNLNMSAGYTWLTVSHVSSSGTTTLYFAESGDELTSNDFPISGVSSGDSFFFTITYITST